MLGAHNLWIDLWFTLVHIQACRENVAVAKRFGEHHFVDEATPCDVGEGGAPLHAAKLRRADTMVIFSRVGQHQYDVVGAAQEVVPIDIFRSARILDCLWQTASIVIQNTH